LQLFKSTKCKLITVRNRNQPVNHKNHYLFKDRCNSTVTVTPYEIGLPRFFPVLFNDYAYRYKFNLQWLTCATVLLGIYNTHTHTHSF